MQHEEQNDVLNQLLLWSSRTLMEGPCGEEDCEEPNFFLQKFRTKLTHNARQLEYLTNYLDR